MATGYYCKIEIGTDRYVDYGPYPNVTAARKAMRNIVSRNRTKYKDGELLITRGKSLNGVVGQVSTMNAKAEGKNGYYLTDKVLYWIYFADPYGDCNAYIMNADGTLKRKLKDEEW